MDFGKLFFSVNGRIGQKDYWIGIASIVGANLFLTWIPFLGTILWLVLIWTGIAVYGKRLHDAGKSAWLHVAPWGLSILFVILGAIMIGGTVMAAALGGDEITPAVVLAGGGAFGGLMLLNTLVWVGYTIWVGVMASDPSDNIYGPAPVIDGIAQPMQASAAEAEADSVDVQSASEASETPPKSE